MNYTDAVRAMLDGKTVTCDYHQNLIYFKFDGGWMWKHRFTTDWRVMEDDFSHYERDSEWTVVE